MAPGGQRAIVLTPLRRALAALQRSLGYLASDLAADPGLREQFRAAAIQGFEFTHEIAFRLLKRQLEQMAAAPEAVDRMTYMEVVRSAAEAGLIADIGRFRIYREKRNITSHTYDEAKAEEIIAVLGDFVADVAHLLAALAARHGETDGA